MMNRKWKFLLLIILITISVFLYWPGRWKYIVIHHSAGDFGNIEHLKKIHNRRQSAEPINAISYHYIIGNGNGMPDGDIESDIRKDYNLWGMHVSARNWDRNFRGLGICIVGNLEEGEMTAKQYQSLIKLTKQLMTEYNIDFEDVGFHGKIEGESTKCPGKHFPIEKFKRELSAK